MEGIEHEPRGGGAKKLDPSMRQRHRAGERAFVDYSGKKPHIVDRRTGEKIPVELFVGVLGASSYTYAEATRGQKLASWIASHTRMLEFFDGSPEIWVPRSRCPELAFTISGIRSESGNERTEGATKRSHRC